MGRISSAEKGTTVTMCCCVNAIGNALPPAYIFPRVHFENHMLKGAPSESLGLAHSLGWMTTDLFAESMRHFVKFMNVSKDNPAVLLMDNHISHLSIAAIDIAKENGLTLLTFPPKCSHKLQPLDVGVYSPFKRYYSSLCDSWMTSNPGKTLSIYDIAELSSQAFQRSFTIENINSFFRATGIFPYNPSIFTDDEFLPALVTDIPLQQDDDGEEPLCVPSTSGLTAVSLSTPTSLPSTSGLSAASNSTSQTMNNEALLELISPYPKANVARKRCNRNKCKTAIITDTPEKENILSRRKKQPAKRSKKIETSGSKAKSSRFKKLPAKRPTIIDSSSNDSNISVHCASDSDVSDESSMRRLCEISESPEPIKSKLKVGDFAIIKVFSADTKIFHRNFVGKICHGPDDDDDFEVTFMKRSEKINN